MSQNPNPSKRVIFVFGSNLAGRHGKGAALYATRFKGAIYGQGEGLQGDSYAIPTKGRNLERLPLEDIRRAVDRFKAFAQSTPDLEYHVTPIGTGLARWRPRDIAPLFSNSPPNVVLPDVFREVLAQ